MSPSSRPSSRRRGALVLGGALLLAGALAGFLSLTGSSPAEEGGAEASAGAASTAATPAPAPGKGPARLAPVGAGVLATSPASPDPSGGAPEDGEPTSPEARRELWQRRLERARHTLDSYREATRYPPQSRPISEQPDQVHPAAPEREVPVRSATGEETNLQLRLRQSRVFVAGEESVELSVACEDARGAAQRCEVLSALASEPDYVAGSAALSPVPVPFAEAPDGSLRASFQPSRQGFAMFSGNLRVALQVRAAGVQAAAGFDILYTPSPPATFTGRVREALEGGSLQLYVGLQVRKAGRYVLAGRVDDAAGQPFAYVTFNEELAQGAQEARFTVFGKLLRDGAPRQPLRLRDVEGFLLLESGDPDRELLSAQLGPVYTARSYPLTAFSDAEWQSPEKQAHLDEFGKDVKQAEDALGAATPP
ncbi:hypothetical protein FGE12_11105 [Aggregicoccus sp. 17bor-14]|uniref:hypothetical protein n=1 Tax=Myxococcaceae TaxID=31 RepID=UPI00129C7ADE|nr:MULTISPECIES: hypothetical protein [Myxococcaceae]MBF5042937.1 hypothetical protein [Simulacricoccus sp. 17bor-14]MRI88703.1 hypothetical protein [Aggregicoccus sp. 17bor-14]